MSCSHAWKTYQGLRESFEYCSKCDIKKSNIHPATLLKELYEGDPWEVTKTYSPSMCGVNQSLPNPNTLPSNTLPSNTPLPVGMPITAPVPPKPAVKDTTDLSIFEDFAKIADNRVQRNLTITRLWLQDDEFDRLERELFNRTGIAFYLSPDTLQVYFHPTIETIVCKSPWIVGRAWG